MNDLRQEILNALTEVWALSPNVRLGQLMAHLGFLGDTYVDKGLGEIDDDELLAILHRHRAELKARLEGSSNETLQTTGAPISVSGSTMAPATSPVER